jgi:hypothetical protein
LEYELSLDPVAKFILNPNVNRDVESAVTPVAAAAEQVRALASQELHHGSTRPVDSRIRRIREIHRSILAIQESLSNAPAGAELDRLARRVSGLEWEMRNYRASRPEPAPADWDDRRVGGGATYHVGPLRGRDWAEVNAGGRALWVRAPDDRGPVYASSYG